jgi:signal peptidase
VRLLRRHVFLLLTFAAVLLWFVLLAPAVIGGPATYVWVNGVSMEPTLENGDLAIVRPAGAYHRGDVVAFRVPEGEPGAGGLVIHRIVGGSGTTGFVMQGDNKNAPDGWTPTDDDVVGRLWFRIPGGARHLGLIRDPVLFGSAASGLTVFLVLAVRGRGLRRGVGGEPVATEQQLWKIQGGHLPRAWASPGPAGVGERRGWRRSLGVGAVLGLVFACVGGAAAALEVEGGALQVFAFPVSIELEPTSAIVDIKPEALQLGSEGEVVTASIELSSDDVLGIDVASVRLCLGWGDCGLGGVPATDPQWLTGRPQLEVQFARGDVIALLTGIETPADVGLSVSGLVGGRAFVGSDVVRVLGPSGDGPPSTTPNESPTTQADPSPIGAPAPEAIEDPDTPASSSPSPSPSNEPSATPPPSPTETSSTDPEPSPVESQASTIESTSPEPVTSPCESPTVAPDVSPGAMDAQADPSVRPMELPIPEVTPSASRSPAAEVCGPEPTDRSTTSQMRGLDLSASPSSDPASPAESAPGVPPDWAVVGAIPFLVMLEMRRRTGRHRRSRRGRTPP